MIYINHNDSNIQKHFANMRAVAIIMQFVGMKTVAMQITIAVTYTIAGGPSADSVRRSPF